MMNKEFGGTVIKKEEREDGVFNISIKQTCPLFRYLLDMYSYPCIIMTMLLHLLTLKKAKREKLFELNVFNLMSSSE